MPELNTPPGAESKIYALNLMRQPPLKEGCAKKKNGSTPQSKH